MIDKINQALSMGWRLKDQGVPGHWSLVPPDEETEFLQSGFNVVQIYIPTEKLEAWLKAREKHEPTYDDSVKAKVVSWFHAEWGNYILDCEEDEHIEIMIEDASADFGISTEQADEWLQEVIDARSS